MLLKVSALQTRKLYLDKEFLQAVAMLLIIHYFLEESYLT